MDNAHDLTGMIIGQYQVRELMEDNGIILTYHADQPRLKRRVALQTLAPRVREDARLRQGMARGAELMASLEHASIVPIIDYGEDQKVPYIVTRSMKKGTLYGRLSDSTFALNDVSGIVRQIASGLNYVHLHGLVHGDPSPRNIGFDESGSAYITDFLFNGLSGEAHSHVRGSKRYMAPERWRDQPSTPATDQYALAVIAYHMLASQSPFTGEERNQLQEQHLNYAPPPIQTFRAEVPVAVNEVLLRGMAKDPVDRYPSVMDFAHQLEKAIMTASEHIFISYSRRDTEYVGQLRRHFESDSLNVWIDAEIQHGDQWFNQIHEAIKTCGAVVVVMTPEAEQSEWVQKEILLAKRYHKPIFPLLLRGSEFALLIDVQFADVRGNLLPGTDFHRRLSRAIHGVV